MTPCLLQEIAPSDTDLIYQLYPESIPIVDNWNFPKANLQHIELIFSGAEQTVCIYCWKVLLSKLNIYIK